MNDTERAERRAAGLARQQADRVAAEEKRRDIEFRRRTSRNLTDIHYLRYVHFSEERTSRMTVAWRYAPLPIGRKRQSIIQLSTALVHPNDQYSKADGRFYSALAFNEGKYIELRLPKDCSGHQYIESLLYSWT